MVARGYDQTGVFMNDPFGEWFESGYRNDFTDENLHYSNELIKAKCLPEGENYCGCTALQKRNHFCTLSLISFCFYVQCLS